MLALDQAIQEVLEEATSDVELQQLMAAAARKDGDVQDFLEGR